MTGGRSIPGLPAGPPISVARFTGGELEGSVSYATIGLSNRPLRSGQSGKDLYLELIASEYDGPESDDRLSACLEAIAKRLAIRSSPLLRGNVIRLDGPLRPGSLMTGFYAAIPVYFDDAFKSVHVEDGRHVAIVWLLPVGPSEIDFIEQYGYAEFEAELIKTNPDLYDLNRSEVTFRA